MAHSTLRDLAGNTDIYLLDQILKGRYSPADRILDAGAGSGRNLHWPAQNGCAVYGIDTDPAAVETLKRHYPDVPDDHFRLAAVERLPFADGFFDHIICCAVLHFARDPEHFEAMITELLRVLRPGGSIFARVATDIGLENKMKPLGRGVYHMPDGTDRFLLTRAVLDDLFQRYPLGWLEPLKVVNVNDIRAMTVLVWQKV